MPRRLATASITPVRAHSRPIPRPRRGHSHPVLTHPRTWYGPMPGGAHTRTHPRDLTTIQVLLESHPRDRAPCRALFDHLRESTYTCFTSWLLGFPFVLPFCEGRPSPQHVPWRHVSVPPAEARTHPLVALPRQCDLSPPTWQCDLTPRYGAVLPARFHSLSFTLQV
jgi:hypothetical protein